MGRLLASIVVTVLLVGTVGAAASCSRGPQVATQSAAEREQELRAAFLAGGEDARKDIAAGTVVIHQRDHISSGAEVRIDAEYGLPLSDPWAICGTGLDHESYSAVIAGYEAEVKRALAAGELAELSLAHKIVGEAELRARFAAGAGTEIGVDTGTLAAPGGAARIDWYPYPRHPGKAVMKLLHGSAPAAAHTPSLPFNLIPQRILWDQDGTTLHALGPDGNLATVDVPTGTWISIYKPKD